MIIDTHCHLDDMRYDADIQEVLARAKVKGVEQFIIPAADPTTLQRAVDLSEKFDAIYFAVGVHPYDASNYDKEFLEPFVGHAKCIAIGECGLDYYRLPKEPELIEAEKNSKKRYL